MTQAAETQSYTDIRQGTFVRWYPHGDIKNRDYLPAVITTRIPTTGVADMIVFTKSGVEVRNAVHPVGSKGMDNLNIRRNGGWSPED